jgi:elongator complex protein 3
MIADPEAPLHLMCVSAIVRDLMAAYDAASTSSTPPSTPNINSLRSKYARQFGLSATPRLTDVLAGVPDEWKDRLRGWLMAKPVRTASGVAVVAVMCKPHRCPHVAMTGNICV